jgi:hypothetical protein
MYSANHCACSFFSKQVSSLFRESSLGGSEMSLKVLERYVQVLLGFRFGKKEGICPIVTNGASTG